MLRVHQEHDLEIVLHDGGHWLYGLSLTYANANQEGGQVVDKVAHFLPNGILYRHCVLVQAIQKLARRRVGVKECHLLLQHSSKVEMPDAVCLPHTCGHHHSCDITWLDCDSIHNAELFVENIAALFGQGQVWL